MSRAFSLLGTNMPIMEIHVCEWEMSSYQRAFFPLSGMKHYQDQDQRTQRSIIEALRDLTDSLQNQNRDLELRNIQLNEEIGNLRQALAMRDSEREQG